MKRIIVTIVLATVVEIICYGEESMRRSNEQRIRLTISGREIIVAMVDNSTARSLEAILPLTLEFQDYAGNEKISYLPRKLDTSDVPSGYEPSPGDLTLYAPWGNLAFFYKHHSYAPGLVPLGTVVSGSELLGELDGSGPVRMEIVD